MSDHKVAEGGSVDLVVQSQRRSVTVCSCIELEVSLDKECTDREVKCWHFMKHYKCNRMSETGDWCASNQFIGNSSLSSVPL